jgi:hypothetical protein
LIVIGSLGMITSTRIDFGPLFLLALDNGFMAVLAMTWIQTHTPQEMLGRMMTLVMLSSIWLMLISQAIAGVLSKWILTILFVLPGVLVLLMTV